MATTYTVTFKSSEIGPPPERIGFYYRTYSVTGNGHRAPKPKGRKNELAQSHMEAF